MIPERKEVPVEWTWDATSIFPDDASWNSAFLELENSLPELAKFQGTLGNSSENLANWFATYEKADKTLGKLWIYASMFSETDTADQEAAAKEDRVRGIYARFSGVVAFAEPEMLAIGHAKLLSWTQQNSALAQFTHYFNTLEKQKAHIRSAEVEELLGQVMQPFMTSRNIHSALADADIKYPWRWTGRGPSW